jgi:hypothetical protein
VTNPTVEIIGRAVTAGLCRNDACAALCTQLVRLLAERQPASRDPLAAALVAVLPLGDPWHANYRPAPPGHLFRTVLAGGHRWLLVRRGAPDGEFEPEEQELATAPDSGAGWTALGARAVEAHSGWRLLSWIGREAGERLREAEAAGQALPSRELEFALDAARRRRIAGRGEWTTPCTTGADIVSRVSCA